MQFKKSILLAIIITLSSTANAALQTYNYTDEDSSVRVTSGRAKPCSNTAGKYTPRRNPDGSPGVSSANNNEITLLCLTTVGDTCKADIYATRDCSGDVVGKAELSLKSKAVTMVISTNDKYVFTSENGGTVLKVNYPTSHFSEVTKK